MEQTGRRQRSVGCGSTVKSDHAAPKKFGLSARSGQRPSSCCLPGGIVPQGGLVFSTGEQ
jgi:hypothetical protein